MSLFNIKNIMDMELQSHAPQISDSRQMLEPVFSQLTEALQSTKYVATWRENSIRILFDDSPLYKLSGRFTKQAYVDITCDDSLFDVFFNVGFIDGKIPKYLMHHYNKSNDVKSWGVGYEHASELSFEKLTCCIGVMLAKLVIFEERGELK
jgi:hypothetical protein